MGSLGLRGEKAKKKIREQMVGFELPWKGNGKEHNSDLRQMGLSPSQPTETRVTPKQVKSSTPCFLLCKVEAK